MIIAGDVTASNGGPPLYLIAKGFDIKENVRNLDAWRAFVTAAGFAELEHYYRPPGLPREQQPWLASAWRKPG